MNDLGDDAQEILELARLARTPSAADKARVERRLGAALGAGVLAGSAAVTSAQASGAAKTLSTGAALKWLLGGGAMVGAALGGYVAVTPSNPPPAQAPVAAAPVAPAQAVPPAPAHDDAPESEVPADSLGAELDLLHRAQASWRRHDAQHALSLLEDHRARYPRSKLQLERDALRVLALCELGRASEAAPIARAFLARAPRSPLRASVEGSCALK